MVVVGFLWSTSRGRLRSACAMPPRVERRLCEGERTARTEAEQAFGAALEEVKLVLCGVPNRWVKFPISNAAANPCAILPSTLPHRGLHGRLMRSNVRRSSSTAPTRRGRSDSLIVICLVVRREASRKSESRGGYSTAIGNAITEKQQGLSRRRSAAGTPAAVAPR
jgi:hypothetical protein